MHASPRWVKRQFEKILRSGDWAVHTPTEVRIHAWFPKKKSPRCRRLQVRLVRRIGFRASAARIRAGFARLPARSPARYGRSASASRSRLDRGSNPWDAGVKEKPPLPEALSSNGAAYRIRTYDVLIRSQTLYPAEVTPQRKTYKTTLVSWSQAQSQTF